MNELPKERYSHSRENPDGSKAYQTVLDHLQGTARLAEKFASDFGRGEDGWQAGMAHDIGKYAEAFQRRLLQNGPKVDHSTAGAMECWKLKNIGPALCVMGHHAGLPNMGVKGDMSGGPTFWGRYHQASRIPPYDGFQQEVKLQKVNPPQLPTPYSAAFYIRMLYSCLVDADFLDTEAFCQGPRPHKEVSLRVLLDKLNAHVGKWYPPKGRLNELRCKILDGCIQKGLEEQPGLFTLTVPTGGGKTVASLAFALNHAVAHHKKRIIYVIPYTSIIDQTVEVFSDILGADHVLAHHSGMDYWGDEDDGGNDLEKARATENWDAEVIVTTAVQFFESLYGNRPSKCRKLHNISQSVIIFDEVQTTPLHYLRPCVYAIGELAARYGAAAVLCTATQPAISSIFAECVPDVPIREICPGDMAASDVFRRVQFRDDGKLSWDALGERLNAEHQALCIVNTRKDAARVHELLLGDGCYHLSTLMFPAHRKRILEEIRNRLKAGLPCKVVSTSLIEAGVDVDFPTVFREITGLTSVIQAAGRCNREGKRRPEDSVVRVFTSESPIPPLFATEIGCTKTIMKRFQEYSSPEAIQAYYQELFGLKGTNSLDRAGILSMITGRDYHFADVAKEFRLIDTNTRTVYIPLGDGRELARRLYSGERENALFRKLNQFSVNIYEQHYASLRNAGDIEELPGGTAILRNLELYSESTGLSLEADFGKALFG